MSFFHHTCKTCYCELSAEWTERKETLKLSRVSGVQGAGAAGGGGGGGGGGGNC
jgi:hypothetical protein